MKPAQLPALKRALEMLGSDNGANLRIDVDIPREHIAQAIAAERELAQLNVAEIWNLVAGDEEEQEPQAKRAPNAHAFLCAAFDGALSDILFSAWRNALDGRAAEHTSRVLKTYRGSNGDATKALYAELETIGTAGTIAVNLFRAQKASERAKAYRRRYKGAAYEKKQWSMENLASALSVHAAALGFVWGWGEDEKQPFHRYVLYVELPTGQVSFHTERRGDGPDYPAKWDGMPGMGAERVCRWVGRLLADHEQATAPA